MPSVQSSLHKKPDPASITFWSVVVFISVSLKESSMQHGIFLLNHIATLKMSPQHSSAQKFSRGVASSHLADRNGDSKSGGERYRRQRVGPSGRVQSKICLHLCKSSFEMCTNITASKYSVICISAESEYEVGISSAEEYRVGPRVKINKYSFDMRR